MKSPALLALLLALSSPLLSSEIPEINCRKMVINFEGNLRPSEIAHKDLLQGIWVLKNTDRQQETRYHFNENGTVDIISSQADALAEYKQAQWHTEDLEEQALLVWKEYGECERFLKIDPTCEGITLTDLGNEKQAFLSFIPKVSNATIKFFKNNLIGAWTNVTYPFDLAEHESDCGSTEIMKDAFLSYQFKRDGTYLKEWGNRKKAFKESGTWKLSKDGGHILLQINQKKGKYIKNEVAKIKLIDMDKLVLEQSLHSPDKENLFCTKKKDFVFVK